MITGELILMGSVAGVVVAILAIVGFKSISGVKIVDTVNDHLANEMRNYEYNFKLRKYINRSKAKTRFHGDMKAPLKNWMLGK